MAIKKYTNYENLVESRFQNKAEYLDKDTKALIEVGSEFPFTNFDTQKDDNIEFHAYSTDDRYLASTYEAQYSFGSSSNGSVILNLNPAEELRNLDLSLGKYKYIYNVYQKLTNQNLYIHAISPSRTEIVLKPVKTRNWAKDFQTNVEFIHFANKVNVGAEVGYEIFDVNQDGTVNIMDIVGGLNPDQTGIHYEDEALQAPMLRDAGGNPRPLTYGEAMIIMNYIIGIGPGEMANFSVEQLQSLDGLELNTMGLVDENENQFISFEDGQTPEDAWLNLANRIFENYSTFDNLDPEKLNIHLNFGDNNFALVTNWIQDKKRHPELPHAVVVKLYKALPEQYQEHQQVSICKFYSPPVFDKIALIGKAPVEYNINQLAPHTKEGIDVTYKTKQMEQFETWDEILGYRPVTSQNLIDFYLSGSEIQQKLNIDYTNYNNFVRFGSAAERLANFKYKLQLVEDYDTKSDSYKNVSGSASTQTYYKKLRDNLVRGFDGYEKFMYYESGSYISQSGLGATTTLDFQDATTPKQNAVKPYAMYSVTSSQFTTWYDNQRANALNHDNENKDSLANQLPTHLRMTGDNVEFLLFMDMVGQHFDTIWTYARHLKNVSNRTHNIDTNFIFDPTLFGSTNSEGMHKDLTYFIAQSMGLQLRDGQDLVKLWKYALGENQFREGIVTVSASNISIEGGAFDNQLEDGTLYVPATATGTSNEFESIITSVYHNSASLSTAWTDTPFSSSNYSITYDVADSQNTNLAANDYTKEIWRRLLNNLPYLAKTKGTSRSIRALISCYGIPATILQIMEYGGPTPKGKSFYTNERFTYALYHTASEQYFPIDWKNTSKSRRPDTIQFRFAFAEDLNTGASIENRNSVRLATLGGGTTSSANWDIRAFPLSGSTAHSIKSYEYGHNFTGSYNSLSASIEKWGYLQFNLSGSDGYKSITSSVFPIFDGDMWNVGLIRESGSDATDIEQDYILYLKKALGESIPYSSVSKLSFTSATSASYKTAFTSSDTLYIPDSGSNVSGGWFSGSIQEFRLWNIPIAENIFNIHTRAPLAFAGGTTSSFYDNLEMRLPFTEIYEHETVGVSTPSVHSSSTVSYLKTYQPTASLINYDNTSTSYRVFEIENNFELPNIGANRRTSNKIRIESSSLDGQLQTYIRSEKRANDYAPIDSPKLDINFNPQQPINEDIISDFAGLEFDDMIGNPADLYRREYVDLKAVKDQYFQRFDKRNNFFDYIRLIQYYDSTLFDQLKNLVPYRAHESVGLIIEPHILERPKYERWKHPDIEENHFSNDQNYYDKGVQTFTSAQFTGSMLDMSGSTGKNVRINSFASFDSNVWSTSSIHNKIGHYVESSIKPTAKFTQEDVDDIMTAKFDFKWTKEGTLQDYITGSVGFKVKGKGSVEDGLQKGSSTDYLGRVQTKDYHISTSYYVGYGGGTPASHSELWYGNPEKEAYHPFVHKQVLNYTALIHSGSQYECVLSDGTLGAKNMVGYGYWDNDRTITGSVEMDSAMASKGFLPSEYTPRYDSVAFNQKYAGVKNTKATSYDGKDPVELFETAPTQLVVSTTSPNVLSVQ
tara:strand:+ start:3622 stop:8316 length:4695 start_codon:yes stop_codon:yes gene_type:complete